MNINQTTKYDIGQTVYFVSHYTSREEIPCTHCGENYREIVNNIEYKCPYCNGGRETRRIDHYKLKSGVITNIHIAVNGIDEHTDYITGDKIATNIHIALPKTRRRAMCATLTARRQVCTKANFTKRQTRRRLQSKKNARLLSKGGNL